MVSQPQYIYVAGKARPHGILYQGYGGGPPYSTHYVLRLVTATSMAGPYDYLDFDGADLTNVALLDHDHLDPVTFCNIFYYDGLYYLYFANSTASTAFSVRLATSATLMNGSWTNYGGGEGTVLFPGVQTAGGAWDYDDDVHDSASANALYGWHAPWVGRLDEPDGTPRWIMIIPTVLVPGASCKFGLALFTSPSPIFTKANRHFEGIIARMDDASLTMEGVVAPTRFEILYPKIIVGDASSELSNLRSCDLTPTVRSGGELWLSGDCRVNTANGENSLWLRHADNMAGAVLTDCDNRFPLAAPMFQLAPRGSDANVKFLLLAASGGMFDLSGNGVDMRPAARSVATGGVDLEAGETDNLRRATGDVLAHLEAITGDFTLRFRCSMESALPNGSNRVLLGLDGAGGANEHWYLYLNCDATGYRWRLRSTGLTSVWSDYVTMTADGTLYRWEIVRSGSSLYFFKDGVLQGAVKTFAGALTTDTGVSVPLRIGVSYDGSSSPWDGILDEVEISSVARHTAGFTPAALAHGYATAGAIFTRVFDRGSSQPMLAPVLIGLSVPAGCAVTITGRIAASAGDQSTDLGDFGAYPGLSGRYQQFAIAFTGPGTATGSFEGLALEGVYNLYYGTAKADIDYTTPVAQIRAGIAEADVSDLGLAADMDHWFGLRAQSCHGVEEDNTTVVTRVRIESGALIGDIPNKLALAQAQAAASGRMDVHAIYVATGQQAAPAAIEIAPVVNNVPDWTAGESFEWPIVLGQQRRRLRLAQTYAHGETLFLAARMVSLFRRRQLLLDGINDVAKSATAVALQAANSDPYHGWIDFIQDTQGGTLVENIQITLNRGVSIYVYASGILHIAYYDATGTLQKKATTTAACAPVGSRYKVFFSWNGSAMSVTVNGVAKALGEDPGVGPGVDVGAALGCRVDGITLPCKGTIRTAALAAGATALHDLNSDDYPDDVSGYKAFWRYDRNNPLDMDDASGNGNDLLITGAVWQLEAAAAGFAAGPQRILPPVVAKASGPVSVVSAVAEQI